MCWGRSLKCSSLHKFYYDPHELNQTKGVSNFGDILSQADGESQERCLALMEGYLANRGMPGSHLNIELQLMPGEKGEITHGVNQSSSESKVKLKGSISDEYLV